MASKVFEVAFKLGAELTSSFKSAFKDAGSTLKTLSGAVAAIGGVTAISNVASQVDAVNGSFNKLQIQTGITGKEFEELQEISKNLFKENYGENIEEVNAAVANVKQNMAGLDNGEIQKVAGNAMLLAENFDADINEVTRAANNMIKNFGIESENAFDLFAAGAQRGLNFSDEMFDNVAEYAPLFSKMGYTAEEYFGIMERGAKAGVYNLDYVNDVMKEFQIRTKDGSKSTNEAMAMMSEETQNVWESFLKGKGTVSDVANSVVGELKNMDDQIKANQIGVSLFGPKWEDLEADAIYAMLGASDAMKDYKGRMEEINRLSFNTAGDAIRGIGRILMTDVAMPISNAVLPPLTTFANYLSNNLPLAVEKTRNIIVPMAPSVLGLVGAFAAYKGSMVAINTYQKAFNIVQAVTPSLIHAHKAAMLGYTFAGKGMKGALIGLSSGLKTLNAGLLANPFILAAGAIAGIGVALYTAYQKSETFRNAVKPIVDTFANGFDRIKDSVKETMITIIPLISETIESIIPVIAEIATVALPLIQTAVQTIFPLILSVAMQVFPIIVSVVKSLSEIFITIAQTAIPMIASVIQAVLPVVLSVIQAVIPIATTILQTLSTIIETVIIPAIAAISSVVETVFPYVQIVIETALAAINGIINTAMSLLKGDWAGAWEAIKTTVTTIVDNIIGFFSSINLFDIGKKIVLGLINGIKSMGGAILDGIMSLIPGPIKKFASNLLGGGAGKAAAIPQYATGGIVNSPTMALVGEGGDTESIIPWNNSERSKNLWLQTGQALGMLHNQNAVASGGQQLTQAPIQQAQIISPNNIIPINRSNSNVVQVTFSPVYNVSGSQDLEEVEKYARDDKDDLIARISEIQRNERRLGFG